MYNPPQLSTTQHGLEHTKHNIVVARAVAALQRGVQHCCHLNSLTTCIGSALLIHLPRNYVSYF